MVAAAAAILVPIITGWSNYLLEVRKERRAEVKESARHETDLRRAARYIHDDLSFALAAARTTVETKAWWYSGRPLTWEGWHKYRDIIEPELSTSEWHALRVAVMAIDHLQMARDGAARSHQAKMKSDPATASTVKAAKRLGLDVFEPIPTRLSDADVARVVPIARALDRGVAALAPFVQDKQPT